MSSIPNSPCTKSSKRITVFLNGNKYDSYNIVINSKKLRKWHHILNEITEKLNPDFGVIKKLYSSVSGMTLNSFTDLQDNDTYVASDSKKFQFIEGGYNIRKKTNDSLRNCGNEKLKVKKSYDRQNNITIYVHNNGKYRESPKKIVLSKDDLSNWENTVSFIALIMDMPYRNIKFLYSTSGHVVCGPCELQHGGKYVAVGYHEKFIKHNYDNKEQLTELWKSKKPVKASINSRGASSNCSKSNWEHQRKRTSIIDFSDIPKTGGQCLYYDVTDSNSILTGLKDVEVKKILDPHCVHTDCKLHEINEQR